MNCQLRTSSNRTHYHVITLTSAIEETQYSYQVDAYDPDPGTVLHFSAHDLPSWLTLDSSTGLLTGIPDDEDVGEHQIYLAVTDGVSVTATQNFQITVANVNDRPVMPDIGDIVQYEDAGQGLVLSVFDPDTMVNEDHSNLDYQNGLTFTGIDLPEFVTVYKYNKDQFQIGIDPKNGDVAFTKSLYKRLIITVLLIKRHSRLRF